MSTSSRKIWLSQPWRTLGSSFGLLAALQSLISGCNTPLSGHEFEVDQPQKIYADGKPVCAACMASTCPDVIDDCQGDWGCLQLSRCVREVGDPSATTVCMGRDAVSSTALRLFSDMDQCWKDCAVACGLGTDFACTGNYSAPIPSADTLRITQKLSYLTKSLPLTGARIKFCSAGSSCEEPLAEAESAGDGVYVADVPIRNDRPNLAGFRGYRIVEHEDVGSVRLNSNMPIWNDQFAETSLVDSDTINTTLLRLDSFVPGGLKRGVVFVQIFDCTAAGAGGIVLEVEDYDSQVLKWYPDPSDFTVSLPEISAENQGAGFVANLELGRTYLINARLVAADRIVARGSADLSETDTVYLSLFPSMAEGM